MEYKKINKIILSPYDKEKKELFWEFRAIDVINMI